MKNLVSIIQTLFNKGIKQRTLKKSIKGVGIGLHSGKKVKFTIKPASEDTGILFKRIDRLGQPKIFANLDNMKDSMNTMVIEENNNKVSGIEHLLSALMGMGIDNACVELSAEEMPVFDGSAGSFVFMIENAGIKEQSKKAKYIRINKEIFIQEKESWIRLEPFEGFKIDVSKSIECLDGSKIKQYVNMDFSKTSYVREVSRARNCLTDMQLKELLEHNKAQGVSDNNTIVINNKKNHQPCYRFEDELIRHHVLDVIGVLKLLGGTLNGLISGHNVSDNLIKKALLELKS